MELRVTAAVPGRVALELDIEKQHTVNIRAILSLGNLALPHRPYAILLPYVLTILSESSRDSPWRNDREPRCVFVLALAPIVIILLSDIVPCVWGGFDKADLGGSLAVASHGLFATGVTTDLNVACLRGGGKVGDRIQVHVLCDRLGKSVAYTTIKFVNEKRQLVARGSHTKYIAHARHDENNRVDEIAKEHWPEQDNKKQDDEAWVVSGEEREQL